MVASTELVAGVGVEFRLLGAVEVRSGGHPLPLGAPRAGTILGILLVRPGALVGIDQFIDELWPAAPPSDARTLVHGYVSRLRRALRRGAGDEAAGRLVTRKPGYLLRVDGPELDLHRFNDLLDDARQARRADDPRRCLALLRRAQRLWRGHPFADIAATPAIAAAAARLTELRLTAYEEQFDVALEVGDHADLVAELTELVAAHPLRERLIGQLMLAQHRTGRTAAAIATYHDAKVRLAAELGIQPGPLLGRLGTTLLNGELRPDTPPTVEPPPAKRGSSLAQLPMDLVAFTGRASEVRRLLSLRSADTDRAPATTVVCAIDGMAGVGKTALAVHAAHQLADSYPDGQIFIDLNGIAPHGEPVHPRQALGQILRSLSVPGDQLPVDRSARVSLFRSIVANRRLLLLLDNARDERQVLDLLPAAPHSLVIITSRRRLTGLDDVHTISLDVPPTPDAAAMFTRACPPRPAGEQVVEIVELCGRLPLAIRNCAARLRHRHAWSLEHLAVRLRGQDHLFDAGLRSVATAVDLSYRDLTVAQGRMFRLLGLHPGDDIDVGAAAALNGGSVEAAGQLLEDLLDVNLVQQEVPERYYLHELFRMRARSLCRAHESSEERQDALTRLFDHYFHTAAVAMDLLYPDEAGDRPRPTAIRVVPAPVAEHGWAATWLDAEMDNLLAAAAAARHAWPAHTVRMSATLVAHLHAQHRDHAAEALRTQARQANRRIGRPG